MNLNTTRLSGDEAFARGAIEAGVSVVASYPGEPVSIPVEVLAKNAGKQVHVEWSVNEKVAYEVALGASYAGLRAIVFVKHVGFNWILDPLAGSSYTGVGGGLVVVVGDDPDATGSTSEEDTRILTELTELPLLEPSTPDEARVMVRESFPLSEGVSLPVIVRAVTRLCRQVGPVGRGPVRRHNLPKFEGKWFVKESLLHQHTELHEKNRHLEILSARSPFNTVKDERGARVGIIGCGSAAQFLSQLSEANPGKLAVMKLGFVRPPPRDSIISFAKKYQIILVAEEVQPFLESKIRQILVGLDCSVYGRLTGHLPWAGSLTPELLASAAEKIAGTSVRRPEPAEIPMMMRTSLYDLEPCAVEFDAACPHLATFTALRGAIQRARVPVTVTGDVGCMSLDIRMGHPVIETMTCMGASPSVAAGVRIALPDHRVIAVIGDSSFFHSGIQGVLNNLHQGIRIITLVLDNMITAQSGFQPRPGSLRARTMMDELIRAMGSRVLTMDSFKQGLEEALLTALRKDESLVIISRGRCPLAEKVGAYQTGSGKHDYHPATSIPSRRHIP